MNRVVDAGLLRFAAGEAPPDDGRVAQAMPTPQGPDLPPSIAMLERLMIQDALADCGGNKTAAAARLGVTRRGLEKKMQRLGVSGEG